MIKKKPYEIRLPSQLPKDLHVSGYESINPVGENYAYSPRDSISKYLRRFIPNKAGIILRNLEKINNIESFAKEKEHITINLRESAPKEKSVLKDKQLALEFS